jgi:hypothetical protein
MKLRTESAPLIRFLLCCNVVSDVECESLERTVPVKLSGRTVLIEKKGAPFCFVWPTVRFIRMPDHEPGFALS